MRNLYLLSLLFAVFTAGGPLGATVYPIDSADDLDNISLVTGDTVVFANGTYVDQELRIVNAEGTAEAPIVIMAETPGGVIFQGESPAKFSGSFVIVEGFYWQNGVGENNHVEFRRSGSNQDFCTDCVIRNCAFDNLFTEAPDKSRWIVMYGQRNTVENCTFQNKNSTGVAILVELSHQGETTADHLIRNNYFYNFTPKDDFASNTNDSEAIRIGSSNRQTVRARVTVEHNYFQATDGENEIISNKSAGNVYEHNTFRACRGSLVLRHGAGATVNGNFFLGEQKAKSGGVRITDSDHIITNNYFAGLSNGGDRWNNSITIVAGSETSGGSSNGYQEVDDILVAYNTFYQTDDPIYYNDRDNDVSSGTIAYNLAYSTRGALIAGDVNDTGSGMTYAGNIFGGSALGIDEASFTIAEVDFEAIGEVSVPVAGSVVSGAAGDAYADVVSEDNFGLLRPETDLDVGAHEIEGATGEILFRPLTNDDVGNGVGASFLTADGHSGVAQSMSVGSLDRFGGEGGSQELDVFSNVAWTATTDADWITLTGGMGTNNGSITVTVGTYDGDDIRTGTITISGEGISRTVGVSQGVALSPANCPSGTNVAVEGSIASFTSQQNDDNAAANLIDADAGNRWSAEGFPQSAVIDLGATFLVNEVNLRPHQERDYRFTVEGSDKPAEDFVLLVDATDNTAGGSVINRTFEATPYRYWRLTVTGAATYEGPWVSISEFEVNCSGNFVSTNNPAAAAAGIVLRPVPAGDLLFVDKLPATYDTYSVFDLRGRRLLTGELKVSDGIDLSRVNASGFLVLRMDGPGQPTLVHKFVRRR